MLARTVPVLFFSAGVVIVPFPAVVPVPVALGADSDAEEGVPLAEPFVVPDPVPLPVAVGAIRSSESGVPVAVPFVSPVVAPLTT